jgi:hypothetical protein
VGFVIEASGKLWISAQALCFIPATYYSTSIPYSLVVASATVPYKATTPQTYIFIRLYIPWFKEAGMTSGKTKGRKG